MGMEWSLGQDKTAVEYYQKRLNISEQLGGRPGQGPAYGDLDNDFEKTAQYKSASEYHQRHLDIAQLAEESC